MCIRVDSWLNQSLKPILSHIGTMNRRAIYQKDLAYIHHTGFGDFSRQAGPELLRLLRAVGVPRGTLLDLGCGSGIWAALARRSGFSVVGVDQSAAMVRLAKRVAPRAKFVCSSMHKFTLPSCDVVTSIGEALSYLGPSERLTGRLELLFARVARALRPGGMFLFDVMLREGPSLKYRNWRAGKDWTVLFEVEENTRQRLLIRRNIAFRKIRNGWRRSDEVHRVQLYTRSQVLRALRRAGFTVRTSHSYGSFQLLPRRLAFLARRV